MTDEEVLALIEAHNKMTEVIDILLQYEGTEKLAEAMGKAQGKLYKALKKKFSAWVRRKAMEK